MPRSPEFGDFVKAKRLTMDLSLREFCRINDYDAGNISKLERGILPAPQDVAKLEELAKALNIEIGSKEWEYFTDLAEISNRKIPVDIASDQLLMNSLPVLFRAARENVLDKQKTRELIETLRRELDGKWIDANTSKMKK